MPDAADQPAPRPRPAPPSSISAEAQAHLQSMTTFGGQWPAPDDLDSWDALIGMVDGAMHDFFAPRLPDEDAVRRELREINGTPTWVLVPKDVDEAETPIFIDIHGGAFVLGAGELAWKSAAEAASQRPGVTWSPDYRMPPRHLFPAGLDDCLAIYRAAIELVGPERVVVEGASAGSNLAAATLVRAKEEGLPMPAGLVLLTPAIDLTESGDTFVTNNGIDSLAPMADLYRVCAPGRDLSHPHLSPLFADLTGFPPTFLQSGTRDLLLSSTVQMHRALRNAGVDAELHVWEAMPHGSFGGVTPEDREVLAETRAFERRVLGLA